MSKKTLMVLVVVLAALAVALWMSGRREAVLSGKSVAETTKLLPSVEMNTVQSLAIEDGSATTHLAKADGIWFVEEQGGYPADFNRLREMMRSIDGTENAQVAEEGSAHLAEYGLAEDGDPAPLRIVLEHDKGTTVLNLGKRREPLQNEGTWMPAAGRYVRVDEGPVLLIKEEIAGADANPEQWWDRLLLEVAPESIRQVDVGFGDTFFTIERGTNGTFALAGATEGDEVDVAAANRLFGALRNLRAEKILSAGEADEAFANTFACQAEGDGATYRIQIGEAKADMGGGRPVKIEVAGETEPALAKKLNGRAFLIPAYLAEPLVMKKQELVRKTEPEPEEVSGTAPPAEPPPVPADSASAETAVP